MDVTVATRSTVRVLVMVATEAADELYASAEASTAAAGRRTRVEKRIVV